MAKYEAALSREAEDDLEVIYAFIARSDGLEQAGRIEDRLMEEIRNLETLPLRGKCPEEMLGLGVTDFREIQSPPWRIFFYIDRNLVGIVAVLDGRRNIGALLRKRLLR